MFCGIITSADTVLFTVPTSYVGVIRDVEVANVGGSSDFVSFYVAKAPGSPAATFWKQVDIGSSTWAQWKGRVVFDAGDTLHGFSGSGDFQALISGYLLSSP